MSDETSSPLPAIDVVPPLEPEDQSGIRDEIALCLSGGGYRAMVFHLGCLIRLNETGLLKRLKRVSSVSGGSLTAGVLGLKWKKLQFDPNGVAANLEKEVIRPVRKLAETTIDAGSVLGGIFIPFQSIGGNVQKAFKKHLFGDATLQDLPSDAEGPRFVINATSVQSGVLWRFSKPYMGDYKVGRTHNPAFPLAVAVAASAAFPPILSPVVIDLKGYHFPPDASASLQKAPYTDSAVLSDGGVYDNLGLETAWKRCKTLLVSDAGAPFKPEGNPASDWARHSLRVLGLIDTQVRSLRKISLIKALKQRTVHDGAYWGINTDITDYPKPGQLSCPPKRVAELAATSTRLAALDSAYQDRLINWGYAVCSAALDSHYPGSIAAPAAFPCPNGV